MRKDYATYVTVLWSIHINTNNASGQRKMKMRGCDFTVYNALLKYVDIACSIFLHFNVMSLYVIPLGDMVQQETFLTPTGLFLVSMTIMYLVTAILHPEEFSMIIYGLMYFICIPSGYLLLTIYSLVNMHIVSWGTRESSKEMEEKKMQSVLCDRNCKLCCWDVKIQVCMDMVGSCARERCKINVVF